VFTVNKGGTTLRYHSSRLNYFFFVIKRRLAISHAEIDHDATSGFFSSGGRRDLYDADWPQSPYSRTVQHP
jgi:hypothetical protein